MGLNIGIVEYINAIPLVASFLNGNLKTESHFLFDIPSRLNNHLRTGKIDLGLVSSVEFLDGNYVLLPDFGILSHDHILSVNLYLKKPINSLHDTTIGISSHSATSVALLDVLCRHFWNVKPQYKVLNDSTDFSHYEALLLIGDQALKHSAIADFTTIDLAQAWYYATGLPFVFALFAVRKEIHDHCRHQVDHFHAQLSDSVSWSEKNMTSIENMAFKKCGLQHDLIHAYYKSCKYRLSENAMQGLKLFAELRRKNSELR